jgi:hypothetical protein
VRQLLLFFVLFSVVAQAEKPVKPSALQSITSAQLAVGDLLIVYDLSAGYTKSITVDELDDRWSGGGAGEGDVAGPASSSNNQLVLFDGTTGKEIKAATGTGVCKASSGVASFSTIVNDDVSGAAAIAYSKLSLAGAILNADISGSAAIAYSKLNLAGSIVNADISNSAAIAYSKLNLSDSVLNADINASAGIARSKIATGTADHVVINSGAGAFSSEAQLSKVRGGAGADMSAVTFPSSGVIAVTSGNVATATALAANPSACGAGDFVTDIAADGTLTCGTPAGGVAWGAITGTLSNQTDLQTALNTKVDEVTSVDNTIVRFDGTGGAVQTSQLVVSDAGAISAPAGSTSLPSYAGSGTAIDSGMYFDGTIPTFVRDGIIAGFLGHSNFGFGLAPGGANYLLSNAGRTFTFYGLTAQHLQANAKVGATTDGNTPLYVMFNGGPVYKSVTATGNVGAGEDDLQSKALPARFLYTNQASAQEKPQASIVMWGSFAANGNTKRVRTYIGTTQIGDCYDTTQSGGWWRIESDFQNDESTTAQQISSKCYMGVSGSAATVVLFHGSGSLDMGSARTAKGTAEATSNDDVVSEVFKVIYEPEGN